MSDTDFNAGTRSAPLGDRKAGRSTDLDALAAYVASLNAFDPAPARPSTAALSGNATLGKAVFASLNCASCHGGAGFTNSGENTLSNIGTLKPSSGSRLYATLAGIDVPTLRDVWATAPYLHDGSAPTLEAAVRAHNNVFVGDADLTMLVAYLKEIGGDEPAPPEVPGSGTGLTATYSGNPAVTRVEAIDFDWGTGSPATGVPADNFSARWSGTLTAPSTGTYRFQTYSDDGIRLWVIGVQLINNWTDHAPTTDTSASINLVAGQKVAIQLEFYERGGGAVARLRWQTPTNTTYVAVPTSWLTPLAAPTGSGLTASYFNNLTLTGSAALTRIEAVDFDWGTASPGTGVGTNNFSVRWSGTLVAGTAGNYRLQTVSDDGVRLWVDGVQVINNWSDHAAVANTSATMTLAAGQKVSIRMEYYEKGGNAVARLRWLRPATSTYVAIPAASLLPN
jgi:hypothetical protein